MNETLENNYAGVFSHRVGFGERPALLVVDFVCAYTMVGSPLHAPDVAPAVAATAPLIELARRVGVPVIFTVVDQHPSGLDAGMWTKKIPAMAEMFTGGPPSKLVPELERRPEDLFIRKSYPSAFFGTNLASTLTAARIDTLVVTGCTTSGCIRATAVDGLQHGFRVIVPRDCVADRHRAPHDANLFDIDAKYGDVVDSGEVAAYLEGIVDGVARTHRSEG